MAAFDDFLNQFSYNPETFNEEQFKAAAKSAFEQDEEHYKTEITSRDEKITELDGQTKNMGKALWEAQMKVGPKVPDPSKTPDPSGGDGDEKPKDIKSFFKKVER
jgi:hypothetical protein